MDQSYNPWYTILLFVNIAVASWMYLNTQEDHNFVNDQCESRFIIPQTTKKGDFFKEIVLLC